MCIMHRSSERRLSMTDTLTPWDVLEYHLVRWVDMFNAEALHIPINIVC